MKKKKYYLFEMKGMFLQILSIVILIIMVFLTYLLNHNIRVTDVDLILIFFLMIPYLVFHEILHSLSYVLNGAKFKNITYGVHIEKGVLCCLCKQNISKRNILISLITPFVVIGVVTYIIGMILNNFLLIALSIINISGCSGDLIMFFDFLKLKDFEYSEYDNPMAFGIYTKNDLSNTKLLGLKFIKKEDQLEIKDLRKVSISKFSIIVLIIYLLTGIIDLILMF